MKKLTFNPSLERTRTSRFVWNEFVSAWRLVRAAHAGRYARPLQK
jgi:hypothetical protein